MAIEFDIKITRSVSSQALRSRVASLLHEFGVDDPLHGSDAEETHWGDAERVGTLSVRGATASILAHKAGEEADLGEEGGFWVTASAARSRTGSGVFLTAIVTIAFAQETDSPVTDEAGLLNLGRSVCPEDALAQLRRMAGQGSLHEIGGRFAASLGLASPT